MPGLSNPFIVARKRMSLTSVRHTVLLLMVLMLSGFNGRVATNAGDWPQLLGPNRDGVATGETLHDNWGSSGPKLLWSAPVGGGFAGIAVSGNRAVAFVREGNSEIIRCFDAATGKVQWETAAPCSYQGGVSGDKGPRCVPLISGGFVYTLGVEGRLQCLALQDGKQVWERDTEDDFRPLEGYFGVGSTPVIYKGRLIVNVGGRDDASIVAFDTKTGKTIWQAFQDNASYSSPIIASIDGQDLAVVITRLNIVGLNPIDGDNVFAFPFGARGPTVNGATPVVLGDRVFASSSYNIGSLLIAVTKSGANELWRDEDLLATQYATPVSMSSDSDVLFAIDGRQDAGRGSASLKCLNIKSQKVLWEETGYDYGTLIRVNQELLILTCTGDLIRVAASTEEYRELSRSRVLKPTDSGYRLPALANGRLLIRDSDTVKCMDVGLSR